MPQLAILEAGEEQARQLSKSEAESADATVKIFRKHQPDLQIIGLVSIGHDKKEPQARPFSHSINDHSPA
jgi:hypothetical protein